MSFDPNYELEFQFARELLEEVDPTDSLARAQAIRCIAALPLPCVLLKKLGIHDEISVIYREAHQQLRAAGFTREELSEVLSCEMVALVDAKS